MIPVLRCKAGVRFARIAPAGFRILAALDAACAVVAQDLTITAGTNDHTTGRHPQGEAYDVSVQGLAVYQIVSLYALLQATLGPLFTVLYEVPTKPKDAALAAIAFVNNAASGPHLHLQPLKGSIYPPSDAPMITILARTAPNPRSSYTRRKVKHK